MRLVDGGICCINWSLFDQGWTLVAFITFSNCWNWIIFADSGWLKSFLYLWFYVYTQRICRSLILSSEPKKIAPFYNKKKMLGSLEWHKHSIVNIVSGKHASIVPVRRNTCSLAKPSLNFRMGFTAVWNEKANFNFWKLFSDLSSPLSSNLQNRMVKVNG